MLSEIKIQDVISEQTIGRMRMQFWRDSLENTFQVNLQFLKVKK